MSELYAFQFGQFERPHAAVRIQTSILAVEERRLLTWFCNNLPATLTPNHLTLFGTFGALLVFCGYIGSRSNSAFLWLAMLGYVINWFGDSLDGSIARHRRIERRRYGYFLDHSADTFSIFVIMIGLGLSNYVHLEIAMLALIGYLLMCVHVFLASPVTGKFQLSFLSVGPTELRIGLIILALMMYFRIGLFSVYGISSIDLILCINTFILFSLFVYNTTLTLRELQRTDDPGQVQVTGHSNGPDDSLFWLSMRKSQRSARSPSSLARC